MTDLVGAVAQKEEKYWCLYCQSNHFFESGIGYRHLTHKKRKSIKMTETEKNLLTGCKLGLGYLGRMVADGKTQCCIPPENALKTLQRIIDDFENGQENEVQ